LFHQPLNMRSPWPAISDFHSVVVNKTEDPTLEFCSIVGLENIRNAEKHQQKIEKFSLCFGKTRFFSVASVASLSFRNNTTFYFASVTTLLFSFASLSSRDT